MLLTSKNTNQIYAGNDLGHIFHIDIQKRQLIKMYDSIHHDEIFDMVLTPNERKLFSFGGDGLIESAIDISTGALTKIKTYDKLGFDDIRSIKLTSDGRFLYGMSDEYVFKLNVRRGVLVKDYIQE